MASGAEAKRTATCLYQTWLLWAPILRPAFVYHFLPFAAGYRTGAEWMDYGW